MNPTRASRFRIRATLALLAALTACQWPGTNGDGSSPATGPAARIGPATTLAESLAMLQTQLDSAVASGFDDTGTRNLGQAEAISDRLLETRLPFAWLSAESYSVEARLRQIQSRADRAEAMRAGGARREDVLAEIRALVGEVEQLQEELAAGGMAAPAPVGELLIRLDTTRR
jgi:hypothetical protein